MINDHSCWALVQTKIHLKRKKKGKSQRASTNLALNELSNWLRRLSTKNTFHFFLLTQFRDRCYCSRAIHNNQHKQPGITTLGLLLLHHHHHQCFFVFSFFSTILLLLLLLPLTSYTMTANSTVQNYRAEWKYRDGKLIYMNDPVQSSIREIHPCKSP